MLRLAHRIVLTENCNKSCPHCFNADQRHGANMDLDKLSVYWSANREWLYNAELKIMGGEPTLHPHFEKVVDTALAYFDKITLFTNGSKLEKILHPDILASHWTGKFDFVINGYAFDIATMDFNMYRKYYKFIQLHFVMPKRTYETLPEDIFKKVRASTKFLRPGRVHYIISGDTQVNLTDPVIMREYRRDYMDAVTKIVPYLKDLNYSYSFDHIFPACFWTQDMIDELHSKDINPIHLSRKSCCDTIIGLLDTNFDLWYCNQTRMKIGNVFVNNRPRKIEEINRMLREMPGNKIKTLNEHCQNCPSITTCKSSCWHCHFKGE